MLAAQVEVDFFPSAAAEKPVDIALAALDYARKHYHDVLIVDTAGRLAIDEAMMQEIRELHAALQPDRDAVRGRCDAGPGRGQRRQGVRRGAAADRRGADQARWRCARRRRAVGAADHRQADQVCRRRREARRPRSLPSRPHGLAHPRHGRRAVADRGRADARSTATRPRNSRRRSSPARASTSRISSSRSGR